LFTIIVRCVAMSKSNRRWASFFSQRDILVLLIKLPLHEVIVEALRNGDVLVFMCFFVRSFFIFSVSLKTFRAMGPDSQKFLRFS